MPGHVPKNRSLRTIDRSFPGQEAPRPRRSYRWALATLVWLSILAGGLYANALNNPFIIDDQFLILGDQRVQAFHPAQAFSQEYWPLTGNRLYRPLTTLSFVLNWAVSHQPWAFRLPNLLLYSAAGFLLHLLVRNLTGSTWATRRMRRMPRKPFSAKHLRRRTCRTTPAPGSTRSRVATAWMPFGVVAGVGKRTGCPQTRA